MKAKLVSLTGLLVIAAIVLGVNLIANLLAGRAQIDMTEDKLFTLSKGTEEILSTLPENVSAKLYYSKTAIADVPQLQTYANRVVDLLRTYASLSGGKLSLEILDPRPDTEIEEQADRYGMQGVPTQSGEKLYLGLLLRDVDGKEQVIPFFHPDREQTLEYDVSKAVYGIGHPEKKTIGVISSLPITGKAAVDPSMMMAAPQAQKPWMFIRELRNNFKVEDVDAAAAEIPKTVDLLLIVHPKNLSPATQYAIDQYVLKGGKAAVFVDPLCEADRDAMPENPQMRTQASVSSDLPVLLKAWGVQMETGEALGGMPGMPGGQGMKVVADPQLAIRVPTQAGEQDILVWLNLTAANCNSREIVTSQLKNLVLAEAGSLKKTAASDQLEVTPLLETGDKASTMDDMMLRFGMNPEQIQKSYKPGSTKLMLACKITGKFKTAFPDGKPAAQPAPSPDGTDAPEPGKPTPDPSQVKEAKESGTVIVVADVDMLSDKFSVQVQNFLGQQMVQAINDNLAFIGNAAENMTGSSSLISLRSRGVSQRPFTRVKEIEQRAQETWRTKEEALSKKLEEANQRLSALQGTGKENKVLDAAYMEEVKQLRQDRAATSKALREVKRSLREDVEALSIKVKFVNIALMPLLVIFAGIAIAAVRMARKRRS